MCQCQNSQCCDVCDSIVRVYTGDHWCSNNKILLCIAHVLNFVLWEA